jgi:purine-binding chemotaxis protein CheW
VNAQVVLFTLAAQEFGLEIAAVREIRRMGSITPLPRVPSYVEGIMNLHGSLIPVIDLRARMELPRKQPTRASRIIVAELAGRPIGMIVDAVKEVASVQRERIALLDLSAVFEDLGASLEGLGGDAPKDSQ